MKNKIILIYLAFEFVINTLNAQTNQNYQGAFGTGKANYMYYENSQSDRIYNGAFSYTSDLFIYQGNYAENERNGMWKIKATNKSYANDKKVKVQHNASVAGIYRTGKMDSIWNYSNVIKFFNPKTKKPGTKVDKIISKAQFKENHFVGNYNYERSNPAGKTICTGQFNEAGLPDGLWLIKGTREIEEIQFINGMEYRHNIKDITTGEKRINADSTVFNKRFWDNYDPKNKMAIVDQHMFFLDTTVLTLEPLNIWINGMYEVKDFGAIRNPLYDYRKGQVAPTVYQVKIISCDIQTDCYKKYQERKEAEALRLSKIQAQEQERIRQEILSKEEEMRKEKERQQELLRKEEIAKMTKNADNLFDQKKYRQARVIYEQVNIKEPSTYAVKRVTEINKLVAEIDKAQQYRTQLYDEINGKVGSSMENTARLESELKTKKKVYAVNYKLCIETLSNSFNPKFNALSFVNEAKSNPASLEVWTEADQNSVLALEELKKEQTEIINFQNAVSLALSTNNKAHLRILNSSLNPKVIIHDMIQFK